MHFGLSFQSQDDDYAVMLQDILLPLRGAGRPN